MGREDCSMCDIINGVTYCGFQDAMYSKCTDRLVCPDGLDDDDMDDDDDISDFDDDFYDTNDTPI